MSGNAHYDGLEEEYGKRLLKMNTVALAFDVMFLGASLWLFIDIAQTMSATVAWYYLLLAFLLPIAVPTYTVLERAIRGGYRSHHHAITDNPVSHAYDRADRAMAGAVGNSFGVNTLIFWLPFFIDNLESPAQLTPDMIWRFAMTRPAVVFFGIICVFSTASNLIVHNLYRRRARYELLRWGTDSPIPSPHGTMEMRVVGDQLHSMPLAQTPLTESPHRPVLLARSSSATKDGTRVVFTKSTQPVVAAAGRLDPKKKRQIAGKRADPHASSSAVERSLDDTRRSVNGLGGGAWV